MKINELVKKQRIELKLNTLILSQNCGITEEWYSDIEDDESEFYMVLTLEKIKILFYDLKIDIEEAYNFIECKEAVNTEWLISKINNCELSIKEISDMVGIYESEILKLMNNVATIENWVIDPLLALSNVLNINPSCLIKMAV